MLGSWEVRVCSLQHGSRPGGTDILMGKVVITREQTDEVFKTALICTNETQKAQR